MRNPRCEKFVDGHCMNRYRSMNIGDLNMHAIDHRLGLQTQMVQQRMGKRFGFMSGGADDEGPMAVDPWPANNLPPTANLYFSCFLNSRGVRQSRLSACMVASHFRRH